MSKKSWDKNVGWQRVAPTTPEKQAEMKKRLEDELSAARGAPKGGVKIERDVKALRRQQLETELQTVKVVRDHEGTQFASYVEMAEHWGINRSTLLSRLSSGRSLEEALTGSLKHTGDSKKHAEKKLDTGMAEVVGGAIVEQLTPKYIPDGINGTVANEILAKTGGHSFRSSYETFKLFCDNHKVGDGIYLVKYNQVDMIGNIFKSSREFATYYNLLVSEVRRVCNLTGSIRQGSFKRMSLNLALKPVGSSLQGQYRFRGRLFRNFDCACVWAKHDPNKVRLRMAQGENLEDILKEGDPEILKRDVIRYGEYAWVFMDKSKVLRFFGVTEQEVQDAMKEEVRPGAYRTREEAEHVMAARKAKAYAEIEEENKRKRTEKSKAKRKAQEEASEETAEVLEKFRADNEETEDEPVMLITRGTELVGAVGMNEVEAKQTVKSLVSQDEEIDPEQAVESIGNILKMARMAREARETSQPKPTEPKQTPSEPSKPSKPSRPREKSGGHREVDPLAPKKPTKQERRAAAKDKQAEKKRERAERAAKEQEWLESEARRLEAEAKEGKFRPYYMSGSGENED